MTETTTLVQALTDVEPRLRTRAAMELGVLHDPALLHHLVSRLGQEQDPAVRESLTWAVSQYPAEQAGDVAELLTSDNAAARMQAAHVLSKMGGSQFVEQIIAVLDDQDPQVLVKTFRAAASTGDARVVAPLVARLGMGDQELRDALVTALAQLGELSVEPLVAAASGMDARVREDALTALGELGSPATDTAIHAMVTALDDPEAEVRLAAVSALTGLDALQRTDAVKAALASSDPIVSRVARSLSHEAE